MNGDHTGNRRRRATQLLSRLRYARKRGARKRNKQDLLRNWIVGAAGLRPALPSHPSTAQAAPIGNAGCRSGLAVQETSAVETSRNAALLVEKRRTALQPGALRPATRVRLLSLLWTPAARRIPDRLDGMVARHGRRGPRRPRPQPLSATRVGNCAAVLCLTAPHFLTRSCAISAW